MAEYDPTQTVDWENQGYEEAGGDEDQIQHSTEDEEDEEYSLDPSHVQGDLPPRDGAIDEEDAYDPATATSSVPVPVLQTTASEAPAKPSPKPAAKKPRTVGGFLVGDSDSEEGDDGDSGPSVQAPNGPQPSVPSQASLPHSTSSLQNSSVAQDSAASNPNPSPLAQVKVVAPVHENRIETATPTVPLPAPATGLTAAGSSLPRAPVAADRLAQLEERIRDDPRGALDAWLALITEQRSRGDLVKTRETYERFFEVFPQAADIWIKYLELELELNNFPEAEAIFGKSLMTNVNVNLWTKYLDYIRRRNDLNDVSGTARNVVTQAYEFVLDKVGLDKDSGRIWADYLQFLKTGPGTVGGKEWQDQQKMDQMRKTYQRAICVPIANVNTLWKEYDQFEMGLNKLTGRKYLAEKSPSYMSAKSANTALENITRGLQRRTLPVLPPAPGFDGYQEYMEQVEIWKRWINWEKSDPLDLREDKDQPDLYQKRILYVYNQALMALRFWPEMWVEAAEYCFENDIKHTDPSQDPNLGLDYLVRGIQANPESVLLALRHADYIESTFPSEETDASKIARGKAVKAPYDVVLDTLYNLIKRLKERETSQISQVEEAAKAAREASSNKSDEDDDYDDGRSAANKSAINDNLDRQIRAIQQGYAAQVQLLTQTVSFVWIAYIRAMRRIQGKGKINSELGGMRDAFTQARHRGRLTSEVYSAVAQLEWTIYKDPAGGKIFDRGARLFPEDEHFALENIKYLHSREDLTNARVLFETVVNRLTQKPETVHKAKPLYAYFHKYESQFGELAQISKLEKRMAELFPEDPKLALFSSRFSTDKFDPIAARVIVSPATQLRPPKSLMPSIEQGPGASLRNSPQPPQFATRHSPAPQFLPATNSPKRPLPMDDFDDQNQPRKMQRNEFTEFQRGASPIKGAAGRRLDQQRRAQGQGVASYSAPPAPIARDITFLLGLIPRPELYNEGRLSAHKMVNLLREVQVPDYPVWKSSPAYNTWKSGQASSHGGHNRNASSSDYAAHFGGGAGGYGNRDSPAPRPLSPYGASRLASASATYRQSSLRPGSSGSYEPPPAAAYNAQAVPPPALSGQYGAPSGYDGGNGAQPSWAPQAYQQGYAPPPTNLSFGQPPPQQQQQQGGYQPRYQY
ncbi:hypothetical protein QBC35DRAFT_243635 [Podospora australis]|uniref:mRNA 3'-end-processing protein RNA14 n=1 Tax=Podospora australis TaxID=1536484 RepID=A0AAN6X196_9PEZI|nr:hypothetical protein QBC35DRAFT_243635 [Podospora australis]